MTDKVQKIREEVKRMHNLLPITDGDNISVNYADRICTTLEMYIDSLQEEHDEIIDKYLYGKEPELVDADDLPKEEPVSEDLEEAAIMHYKDVMEYEVKTGLKPAYMTSFKAGAHWQFEQLMKDALDAVVKIDAGGYPYVDATIELYDYLQDIPLAKEGDKYKVILIKEN